MDAAVNFYARATPEAPRGFLVFVAVFLPVFLATVVIMARDHMGGQGARQRLLPRFAG